MTIYNHTQKLDTALKRLKKLDITEKNKQNIKDFIHYIASNGCSVTRQVKYVYPLEKIAGWLGKDFIKASKEDIQILIEYIDTAKIGNGEPKGIAELRKYIDENKGKEIGF